MKTTVLFTVCTFFLLFTIQAQQQETVLSKKGSRNTETSERDQIFQDEEVPVNDLYDAGGGYSNERSNVCLC